jgi:hypothetical protein
LCNRLWRRTHSLADEGCRLAGLRLIRGARLSIVARVAGAALFLVYLLVVCAVVAAAMGARTLPRCQADVERRTDGRGYYNPREEPADVKPACPLAGGKRSHHGRMPKRKRQIHLRGTRRQCCKFWDGFEVRTAFQGCSWQICKLALEQPLQVLIRLRRSIHIAGQVGRGIADRGMARPGRARYDDPYGSG